MLVVVLVVGDVEGVIVPVVAVGFVAAPVEPVVGDVLGDVAVTPAGVPLLTVPGCVVVMPAGVVGVGQPGVAAFGLAGVTVPVGGVAFLVGVTVLWVAPV